MKKPDWNHYFYSHYQPVDTEWGKQDLKKYERWYSSWINFIEVQYNISFQNTKVLELGCGIGAVCSLLHRRGANVIGSDIATTMVKRAQSLLPSIPFLVYDVMKPFSKKQLFDYVLAFEVLEHVPDLDKGIAHIAQVLKKGGMFIGSTPYPYPKNMIDPTHVNVHPPDFWKKQFLKYRFSSISTLPLSFLPLLWKIPPYWNPVITRYLSYPGIVSTTLIVARK